MQFYFWAIRESKGWSHMTAILQFYFWAIHESEGRSHTVSKLLLLPLGAKVAPHVIKALANITPTLGAKVAPHIINLAPRSLPTFIFQDTMHIFSQHQETHACFEVKSLIS
jgi:hypothetical protein